MSIKRKFSNTTTGIIIMLFIFIGVIFYLFASREVYEKYLSLAENKVKETNIILDEIINDAVQGLLVIDREIENQDQYETLLNLVYQTTTHTSTVYIGDDTNGFVRYPNRFVSEDYLPTKRTWYQNSLVKNDAVVWSDPYVDHGTGDLTITGSKRIQLSSRLNGVVGIDILLNSLSEIVSNQTIGTLGHVYLVSKNGDIIAHKNPQFLGVNVSSLKTTPTAFKNNRTTIGDEIFLYDKNDATNIQIVAVVNKNDIKNDLKYLIYLIISIFVLMIFITRKLSFYFGKKFAAPIENLVQVADQIKNGNYETLCETESNDEIGILIEAFNGMSQSILNNTVELQALNEQLKASEEILKEQYDTLYENNEYIKKNENRYKFIFEASKEGLWDTDECFNFYYLTPLWYSDFGIDTSSSSYDQWEKRIHPEDQMLANQTIEKHIQKKTDYFRCEYRVLNAQMDYRWIEVIGKSRFDENGKFQGLTGSHLDITIRKEYELKILDMAYKDDLTKLYNRAYFQEYVSTFIQSGQSGAIVFTDINNFKHINDIYGHSFGDEVLKQLAGRLSNLFGDVEKYVLARFSGDEFIILIKNITDKKTIEFIMATLVKEIKNTIYYGNKFFQVSSSTGITLFPNDGNSVQTLLQNADIAMYHSKRISKKDYHFYDEEIKSKTVLEIQLENNLKSAIDNGEIFVHYQPIIKTSTNEVTSFEALVRWKTSDDTWIPPDLFIPIAEKTGLINEIGMLVFEKSCAFIKNQSEHKSYKVAVNISVVQLMEDHFANKIMNLTKQYGLSNDQIILEITESMTLETNENIIAKLFYLRNHKFGIALDDFGTGYSSFRNLISLPLTSIKMDRSIIQESIYNDNVYKLLTSIVDFAHKSNIEVVAEGIEDTTYYKTAFNMKADFMQGYHISRPLDEIYIMDAVKNIDLEKDLR